MNNKTRLKDVEWVVGDPITGKAENWERAGIAVLMDIRDELKKLNSLLYCQNFTSIPQVLREIRANTRKRKRKAGARS